MHRALLGVASMVCTALGCVPSTGAPGGGGGGQPPHSKDAASLPPPELPGPSGASEARCHEGQTERCALLPAGCPSGLRACFDGAWSPCVFDRPQGDPPCTTQCTGGLLGGDSLLTPVNRFESLRPDWAPTDLAIVPAAYRTVDPRERMRLQPLGHMIEMLDAEHHAAAPKIFCGSPYRSFGEQCQLFAQYAAQDRQCTKANTYSAMAGHSEHQLGSVCDLVYADNGLIRGSTPGDRWIEEHAYEYGFLQSYPEGTTPVTGYETEPWHYRYVGTKIALLHHELQEKASRAISTHELIATIACYPAMKIDALLQEDDADAAAARAAYCTASKDTSALCAPPRGSGSTSHASP